MSRPYVVVAYDTPSDKRRREMLSRTRGALSHVQRSVFEGPLKTRDLRRLRKILSATADPRADRVRMFVLCASCAARASSLAGPRRVIPGAVILDSDDVG